MLSPDHPSSAASTPTVVAIDGPSGAGKSTVARALARELGFVHLDTGAMFRAVTLFLIRKKLDPAQLDDAAAAAALADLRLDLDADGRVSLDGQRVDRELRGAGIDAAVSPVSALPAVRARLRDLQREFAKRGSLVCEGRDMGTVVFPNAPFKFYLDASAEERARRRQRDQQALGRTAGIDQVQAEMAERDARDQGRALAPLAVADDAVRVDTTGLTVDEVVERLAREVRAGAVAREERP